MKFGKSKIICSLFIIIATFFLFLWIKPIDVGAWWWEDDTKSAAEFLRKHSDWLQYGSFFPFIMHDIGWLLVKLLYLITSFLEGLLPESLSLLKFLDDSGLQGIIKAIVKDLVLVLMVLTIVFLGFKTIIAKEPPNLKNVGVNIFISSFLIVGLPTLMDTMQEVSVEFFKATQKDVNNTSSSLAWNLIKENTADLVYAADNGFDLISNKAEGTVKNGLKPDMFLFINMSEIITPDAIDDLSDGKKELEYLKYTLSTDGKGNYTAIKIKGGFLSFFSDNFKTGYFRYPANFIPMIVGLAALAVAYLFTIFIFVTTIIEIGIKRVVGLFVFATDLESGQRTKMVVQDILNAFLLIAFTGLSFKLYTIFLSFLASSDINWIIYIIALISSTVVLIKGSNTILRYFGIDVGLKEGFGQAAGAFALGAAVAGGLKKFKGNKSKNKGSNSDGADNDDENNENKDKLDNQGDINGKSINDSKKNGGLKNSLKGIGKSLGNMSEGLSGTTQGSLGGAGDNQQNGKSINDPVKGLNNRAIGGRQEGTNSGLNKENSVSDKLNNELNGSENASLNHSNSGSSAVKQPGEVNKSINDSNTSSTISTSNASNGSTGNNGNGGRQDGSEDASLNHSNSSGSSAVKQPREENKSINDPNTSSKTTNNTSASNGSTGLNDTKQTNEQILTDMKLNEAMPNIKGQDASGKLNLEPHVNSKENNTETLRQDMEQGNFKATGSTTPLRQEIEQGNLKAGPSNAASLKLDVDSKSLGNPVDAKQSIIQQIEKASISSNDAKQRIIQEVEKSTMATPQQMQQNVQQVLASARLPQEAQQTVQRVMEDVQKQGNGTPETIKTKVVEELEKASFGAKEPIKQVILQDVQKAFSATPEQVQQNIKQVIQNVESSGVATPKQIQQNVQQVFKAANLPGGTQDVVQKIIQESGPSAAPETLKSKVIQEVEKASFENSQLKQTVIQDIQKAFSPTPEQLTQNINQVFTTTGSNGTSQGNLVNNVSAEETSGYFGSLFGEKVNHAGNTNKVKKSSRFDFIKNM
ncbi:pLS20_p028 family conjugation system transmembrane protein [Peribacillus simplex]|uniref:pLS20_p028 family conjugation system transmembrane protein n=1 Tax=Peribacillus simplex TaxID=1478 RepID=UPI003D27158B